MEGGPTGTSGPGDDFGGDSDTWNLRLNAALAHMKLGK